MDVVVDSGLRPTMALACVEPLNPAATALAQELALRWGVPTRSEFKGSLGVKVVVSEIMMGLGFVEGKKGHPFYVDFLSQAWRQRLHKGLPRNHIFARALGVHKGPWRVVDATAGFGQDALMALSLGADVVALDKSNVVVSILRNGVTRAMREDESLQKKFERLSIVEADAVEYLAQTPPPDVIFLDPMFEKPKKSAKSPKSMQLLQELLGPTNPEHEEELIKMALAKAKHRVVVKRPLKAKALGMTPHHTFKGQSVRYDIYLQSH